MVLFNYFFNFRAVVNLLENQNTSKTIKKLAKKRSLCNMEENSLLLRRKTLKMIESPPEATVFSPFVIAMKQEMREHKYISLSRTCNMNRIRKKIRGNII